jgi:uncharacterized phage protein (TIGR01671 family)
MEKESTGGVIKFRAWDKSMRRTRVVRSVSWELGAPWEIRVENPNQDQSIISSGNLTALNGSEFVLMQFTGLKDKNGKEIYEGDVVELDGSDRPAVMEFHSGSFSLRRIYGGADAYRMEVIGNIYENPELLQ